MPCSTELCRIEHKTDADVAAARDAHEQAVSELLNLGMLACGMDKL